MRTNRRKTNPKVRSGKVLRKNRTELSRHYWQTSQDETVIDRLRPGQGYRHYLTIADVRKFLEIVPNWDYHSQHLDAVILDDGGLNCMGWYNDGIIAVCAWERELTIDWDTSFVLEHVSVLDRLGVETEPIEDDPEGTWCYFDEKSIKGFQLMHIFLHELGHHVDRITTRSQKSPVRGEAFAETYALVEAEKLWDDYFQVFGW